VSGLIQAVYLARQPVGHASVAHLDAEIGLAAAEENVQFAAAARRRAVPIRSVGH